MLFLDVKRTVHPDRFKRSIETRRLVLHISLLSFARDPDPHTCAYAFPLSSRTSPAVSCLQINLESNLLHYPDPDDTLVTNLPSASSRLPRRTRWAHARDCLEFYSLTGLEMNPVGLISRSTKAHDSSVVLQRSLAGVFPGLEDVEVLPALRAEPHVAASALAIFDMRESAAAAAQKLRQYLICVGDPPR